MKGVIVFDLEGQLSPMDLAFELMSLREGGDKVFAVISRYDDLLTLEQKPGYEPGDTLRLIIPFLVYWGITERDVFEISNRAILVDGSKELIEALRKEGWKVYVVSTSYEQHSLSIARRLGIRGGFWPRSKNVFSTKFPLDKYRKELRNEDFSIVARYEKFILDHLYSEDLASGKNDKEIKSILDLFYWPLPGRFQEVVAKVKVMGGGRKVEAIDEICRREKIERKNLVVVGDSITDFKMLKAVKEAEGLAIAFNANEYALPYANIGIASTSLYRLKPVLDAWLKGEGKIRKVRETVLTRRPWKVPAEPPYYSWIGEKASPEVIGYHKECRKLVRGKAAKLG